MQVARGATPGRASLTMLRLVCLALAIVSVPGGSVRAAQEAKPRTVWDGVYTDAQASRATATFSQSCANCHTLAADGNRPLAGDAFWRGFTQKTVADLLTYVRTNMPNGVNAGSLPASTYADLVALILKTNNFPAGTTEVTPEAVVGVQIIPKDGPGELPANTLVRVVGCLAKSGSDWVLTNATVPARVDRTGPAPEDATRALGTRSVALKFVLTRLDQYAGQRMSVSGILIGVGGADGINVTTVNRVAETCP
jgi:mono/diheme cytochrome c family protein